jgi:DNA-binding beta-propeller fold protein YncE
MNVGSTAVSLFSTMTSLRTCLLALCLPLCARADQIVLVAGGGTQDAMDIAATDAILKEPFGTAFDSGGHMWIVEMASGNRLMQVDGGGTIQHVAGQLKPGDSGDGGQAIRAQFNGPHNLAILPDDKVLIADTWNGRVRVVDVKARIVSTLEGWRAPKGREKGSGPYCITLNFEGTKLYIADLLQVHELDLATHQSRVVAGNGKRGKPEDGAVAMDAPLSDPRAVAPDRQGNIYILERGGNALRVVDKTGHIRTVVNASGKAGGSGDGGPALEATMSGPKHLCVDKDDSVIIADAEANLVRRYAPTTGMIERIAGTGKPGSAGVGGDPRQCQLARPHGVSIKPDSGDLYITDSYNNRVLKIVKQ